MMGCLFMALIYFGQALAIGGSMLLGGHLFLGVVGESNSPALWILWAIVEIVSGMAGLSLYRCIFTPIMDKLARE